MAPSTAFGESAGAYDAFLYTTIDEDQHGLPLTVLSLLARRNVDPWEEAARLGRLSASTAVRELAGLVADIARGPVPRVDAETIAARLQALLPRSPARVAPAGPGPGRGAGVRREMSPDLGVRRPPVPNPVGQPAATELKTRSGISYFLFYLVFVVLLIGSQWLSPGSETNVGAERPGVERQTPVTSPSTQF